MSAIKNSWAKIVLLSGEPLNRLNIASINAAAGTWTNTVDYFVNLWEPARVFQCPSKAPFVKADSSWSSVPALKKFLSIISLNFVWFSWQPKTQLRLWLLISSVHKLIPFEFKCCLKLWMSKSLGKAPAAEVSWSYEDGFWCLSGLKELYPVESAEECLYLSNLLLVSEWEL